MCVNVWCHELVIYQKGKKMCEGVEFKMRFEERREKEGNVCEWSAMFGNQQIQWGTKPAQCCAILDWLMHSTKCRLYDSLKIFSQILLLLSFQMILKLLYNHQFWASYDHFNWEVSLGHFCPSCSKWHTSLNNPLLYLIISIKWLWKKNSM